MSLSASIVLHKTPVQQLLKAVNLLLESPIEKIFLIDNSPEDSLRNSIPSDIRIEYHHVENHGFGSGHNIALNEILKDSSDENSFHLVMNADVWWDGDVITPLIDYLKQNPEVGMVMPKVFYPDGSLQYTARLLPTPYDVFAKRFFPTKLIEKRMERYLLKKKDHDEEFNCPYLLGSFLLFRNSALKDCGVFDERFFMYPEDIDITRRLHRKWKTMYWPGVSIVHEHAAASRKNLRMLWIHSLNMVRYFNKWGWFTDPERKFFNRRLK